MPGVVSPGRKPTRIEVSMTIVTAGARGLVVVGRIEANLAAERGEGPAPLGLDQGPQTVMNEDPFGANSRQPAPRRAGRRPARCWCARCVSSYTLLYTSNV